MKSQEEIQRARDMLKALTAGEVKIGLSIEQLVMVDLQCDVLCWFLECETKKLSFAGLLSNLETVFSKRGIVEQQVKTE